MPHKLFDFQPLFHETLGQHVAILGLRKKEKKKLQTPNFFATWIIFQLLPEKQKTDQFGEEDGGTNDAIVVVVNNIDTVDNDDDACGDNRVIDVNNIVDVDKNQH